jgi:preprotein translocase subunit Sss1
VGKHHSEFDTYAIFTTSYGKMFPERRTKFLKPWNEPSTNISRQWLMHCDHKLQASKEIAKVATKPASTEYLQRLNIAPLWHPRTDAAVQEEPSYGLDDTFIRHTDGAMAL